jgi:hypothetical protein
MYNYSLNCDIYFSTRKVIGKKENEKKRNKKEKREANKEE